MKKDDVELQRVYEKPLTLFSKTLRVKNVILITFIGVFLGIFGFLEVQVMVGTILIVFNAIFLIFSALLYQKSILYFGEFCVEATSSGDMFITKLHGHCSKCDGHIKIVKKRKGLNSFISYLQCKKNSQHVWNLYNNSEKSD